MGGEEGDFFPVCLVCARERGERVVKFFYHGGHGGGGEGGIQSANQFCDLVP